MLNVLQYMREIHFVDFRRFCKTLKIERERERSRKETNLLHSHVHAQNVAPHFIKFTNREIREISLSACKITVLLNRCCYAFVIGLLLSSCSLHSFDHPVESIYEWGLVSSGFFVPSHYHSTLSPTH